MPSIAEKMGQGREVMRMRLRCQQRRENPFMSWLHCTRALSINSIELLSHLTALYCYVICTLTQFAQDTPSSCWKKWQLITSQINLQKYTNPNYILLGDNMLVVPRWVVQYQVDDMHSNISVLPKIGDGRFPLSVLPAQSVWPWATGRRAVAHPSSRAPTLAIFLDMSIGGWMIQSVSKAENRMTAKDLSNSIRHMENCI